MSLSTLENQLIAEVKELLESGKVRMFVGFTRGFEAAKPVPAFIDNPQDAEKLVLNPFVGMTIAKYALEKASKGDGAPVGMLVKGCDGLGLARLFRDRRVNPEDVYVVGYNCRGMVDADKARARTGLGITAARLEGDEVHLETADGWVTWPRSEVLLDKCLTCENPVPPEYEVLLGDEGDQGPVGQRDFADVAALEALSPDERYQFWSRQFERCLRCFACRNACAACNCITCSLEDREVEWLGKNTQLSEQFMFHFTRAYHVAGRCVGCGECQKVCPVDIPLMLLNEKLMRDIRDLFGVADPQVPRETEPLGEFNPEDPEGWREEDERA